MTILLVILFVTVAWRWGDWKNWKLYYPSILFFILGDLLYHYLLFDFFPMWRYNPFGLDESLGLTHTFIAFLIMFFIYPASILLYLGHFPTGSGPMRKFAYYIVWIGITVLIEYIIVQFNGIQYYNGWSLTWSALFVIVMLFTLRIHHIYPLAAWVLSLLFITFLLIKFQVPFHVFR
ncbi:hypothetical protein EJF36_01855 [Bacillus sp. HMF5848]|uniref:CBO0543 family protein n=1 Tax=Bacillus sp. HMF5848 TaxID=2495421 RepID=UPI000F7A76A4|nr:CBO0543 family protein [Bacillus sp. HMF5848]RSK25742.1 hypothetical protein EJF36_01855 [Bacillus sp. HMF5848]